MLVGSLVVDPRGPDLERPGAGHHRSRPSLAIAGHERAPFVVALSRGCCEVGVHLGLQCGSQHPAGTVTDDLIENLGEFRTLGLVLDYPQHRRLLPASASNAGIQLVSWEGTPRALSGSGFHNFWSYLSP